jgi:hypothetical protein
MAQKQVSKGVRPTGEPFRIATEAGLSKKTAITWLLIGTMLGGGMLLLTHNASQGTLALYGVACGGVLGARRVGARGLVEGAGLGLVTGLISPMFYDPIAWLLDLPLRPTPAATP